MINREIFKLIEAKVIKHNMTIDSIKAVTKAQILNVLGLTIESKEVENFPSLINIKKILIRNLKERNLQAKIDEVLASFPLSIKTKYPDIDITKEVFNTFDVFVIWPDGKKEFGE